MPPVEETDTFEASDAYRQAQADDDGDGDVDPSGTEDESQETEARNVAADDPDATAEKQEGGETSGEEEELSTDEKQQVSELKDRDSEVRAHEAAHMAAGGSHVRGGATFSYQQGPDGKQYAIGGEVGIDVSAVSGDPQATIQKMEQVRAAALAPASPSSTDRSVAAKASQIEMKARQQIAEQVSKRYSANAGWQEDQETSDEAEAAGSTLSLEETITAPESPSSYANQRLEALA